MNYCPNCGTQIDIVDSKFCVKCGTQLECSDSSNKQETKPYFKNKQTNKNRIILICAIALLVVALITLFLLPQSVDHASMEVLSNCTELLGAKTTVVLSDSNYSISRMLGIVVAKKATEDVFGIEGENVIIFVTEDKYIEIVTWQSDEDVTLTESQINKFLSGMKKAYGKYEISEDDEGTAYMWHKNEYDIMLKINADEAYITWVHAE